MVLDYYVMDIERTYMFIHDECGYNDDISTEEIIYELLHDGFCKYINKKGKNIGNMCQKKIRKNKNDVNIDKNIYCHFHKYREKICFINNCNKKCKIGYNYCKRHLKFKTKIETIKDEYSYKKPAYKLNEEENRIDNFICFYSSYNIYNIKICKTRYKKNI